MKKMKDLNKTEDSNFDFEIKQNNSNEIKNGSIDSGSSSFMNSKSLSYESEPYNDEINLDLPDFSPTKYNSVTWKILHSIFYSLYSFLLFGANILYIKTEYFSSYNFFSLISHISYFFSSFMEWLHFNRGCIVKANYNSVTKSKIDNSLKAKILRSEKGWIYFFSVFASMILIYGNIYYILYNKKNNEDKLEKEVIPNYEFWNVNAIGSMIISLAQILKIEKILIQTNQYLIKNDLSNCLIEIFLYFGSLVFGTLYFFNIMYDYDTERFEVFYNVLRIAGSVFILFSALCLLQRYFGKNYEDLNLSTLSNATI